jgi:hypothetical protein
MQKTLTVMARSARRYVLAFAQKTCVEVAGEWYRVTYVEDRPNGLVSVGLISVDALKRA